MPKIRKCFLKYRVDILECPTKDMLVAKLHMHTSHVSVFAGLQWYEIAACFLYRENAEIAGEDLKEYADNNENIW